MSGKRKITVTIRIPEVIDAVNSINERDLGAFIDRAVFWYIQTDEGQRDLLCMSKRKGKTTSIPNQKTNPQKQPDKKYLRSLVKRFEFEDE